MKKRILFTLIFSLYYGLTAIFSPYVMAQTEMELSGLRRNVQDMRVNSPGSSFGKYDEKRDLNGLDLSPIPAMGPGTGSAVYYSVHVLGEIKRPGTYKILPSDRVSDALKYAGGILSQGSQRYIQLRRGAASQSVDIFAYNNFGSLNNNPYLMENDVIYVPLKQGEIQIAGPVNRPGEYEVAKPISLKEVIRVAGGFSVGRSLADPIGVIRFDQRQKKQVLPVANDENSLKRFMVQKGDFIVIPHILTSKKKFDYSLNRIPGDHIFFPTTDDNVYVIGAVNQPGPYAYQPTFSFRQYVNMAGPNQNAKLGNLKVILPNGRKVSVRKNQVIQPGDTIYIRERRWRTESILGLVASVLGITLTTIALKETLAK